MPTIIKTFDMIESLSKLETFDSFFFMKAQTDYKCNDVDIIKTYDRIASQDLTLPATKVKGKLV